MLIPSSLIYPSLKTFISQGTAGCLVCVFVCMCVMNFNSFPTVHLIWTSALVQGWSGAHISIPHERILEASLVIFTWSWHAGGTLFPRASGLRSSLDDWNPNVDGKRWGGLGLQAFVVRPSARILQFLVRVSEMNYVGFILWWSSRASLSACWPWLYKVNKQWIIPLRNEWGKPEKMCMLFLSAR